METCQGTKIGALSVRIFPTNQELGNAAGGEAVRRIRQAVRERGAANIILATGNSQLRFLAALGRAAGVPWERVRVFLMDEYVTPKTPPCFWMFIQPHKLFPRLSSELT
jgi:glucosamine-6-phosphate deaminase